MTTEPLTRLNPKTDLAQRLAARWRLAAPADLDDAYENPSYAKRQAWAYCRNLCESLNGRWLRVVGHNAFAFSAAFEFDDPERGRCLCYVTKSYNYVISLE